MIQVKEAAKRCVFSRRLKVPSVCDAVTLDGKLFQTRGAATKKARSPIVERRDDGVTRADVDAERSRLLASMSATRHCSFATHFVLCLSGFLFIIYSGLYLGEDNGGAMGAAAPGPAVFRGPQFWEVNFLRAI